MANVFCPWCANLLVINANRGDFACLTCPYFYQCAERVVKKDTSLPGAKKDGVEAILSEEQMREGQEVAQTDCPECGHTEAFFKEMQTRFPFPELRT